MTEPPGEPEPADPPPAVRGTVRMRDIAEVSGVSPSTVSRVLNNAPSMVPIAKETRERVIAAARTLGYRPNPLARGLRGAPTMLIGVVVRDFSDPFNASAIEGLAVEAMARNYNIVLGHAHGQTGEGLPLSAVLEIRHCDAVILLSDMQDQPRLLADLRASVVPVVALWQGASPLQFPTVDVDDRAGILAGVEHLVGLGHRRIGFASGHLPGSNRKREDAYLEAMRTFVGTVGEGWVQRVPNSLEGGESALRALVALPDAPTAVVTSTDLVAVGVLHAAHTLGCVVPTELSVVGFDDLLLAAHTVPALTTVHMPIAEIVAAGVGRAIDMARDPLAPRDPAITVFEPSLVVRQSTARPSDEGVATTA